MAHTIQQDRRTDGGWQEDAASGGGAVGAGTLIRPGEDEEIFIAHARVCDTACTKPYFQSPVGTCGGLCKAHGDPHGSHAGSHLCNTCGHQWT